MIFKTICISICIILSVRSAVNLCLKNEHRLMSLISTFFWLIVSLILIYSYQIKTFLMKILFIENIDYAADVFVHGAILIYAYFYIKLLVIISDMNNNIKTLSRKIAILDGLLQKHLSKE